MDEVSSARRNGFSTADEIIFKTDFDIHPPQMAAACGKEDHRVMEGRREIPEQISRTKLARESRSLGEMALECGFYDHDQGQFGRIFKRETGLTPG